jgi:hypothetical protein
VYTEQARVAETTSGADIDDEECVRDSETYCKRL